MRQKLKSSESERERLQEELAAAHTRIDRLQSKTVAALNNTSKSTSSPNVSENGGAGISKKEEGSPCQQHLSEQKKTQKLCALNFEGKR